MDFPRPLSASKVGGAYVEVTRMRNKAKSQASDRQKVLRRVGKPLSGERRLNERGSW